MNTIWQIPEIIHPAIRSRLAPTPSGYLHLGNALNFIITWVMVRSQKGKLILRIDDMDVHRCKPEYVDDVFVSLEWLGLDWDEGPGSVEEFYRDYSFGLYRERHETTIRKLLEQYPEVYACACSRQQILNRGSLDVYDGHCRDLEMDFQPEIHALRLNVPDETVFEFEREVWLGKELGDFVIWRKEHLPSYQFASLLEDERQGVNLIVRGEDLLPSSAAQRCMAERFGMNRFSGAQIIHHPLIVDSSGEKFSKSRQSQSLKEIRESGYEAAVVYQAVADFLGIPKGKVKTLNELYGFIIG